MGKLAHLLLAAAALLALTTAAAAPADDIPVAVLLDDVDLDNEIKRPAVDLRNPGPPQRQEHETQNPEHFSEDILKLLSLKENIERTQELLRQGFQGVTDNIQKWISNSDQLNVVQQNIQNLRENFSNQIQKLNETLQGFVSGQPQVDQANEESQIQRDFRKVESRLKSLQDNFRSNVNTLSEGVNIVASLKANDNLRQSANPEQSAPAAPAPAPPNNPPQNILLDYVQQVSNTFTNGYNNFTHAVGDFFSNNNPAVVTLQNLFNTTPAPAPAGALADAPEGTTNRPVFPWQNWNLQNFNIANLFNQQASQTNQEGGGNQQAQGPLAIFQGLIPQNPFPNLFPRPSNNAPQPAAPVGNNAVPEPAKPVQPAAPAPVEPAQPEAAAAADSPVTLPAPPVGPIRQILNSIPVVQRIQNTIQQNSKPDTPRDTVKSESVENKGGFYGGNKPNNSNGGDNNDSSGLKPEPVPSEEVPKPIQSEPVKQEAPVSDKTE